MFEALTDDGQWLKFFSAGEFVSEQDKKTKSVVILLISPYKKKSMVVIAKCLPIKKPEKSYLVNLTMWGNNFVSFWKLQTVAANWKYQSTVVF